MKHFWIIVISGPALYLAFISSVIVVVVIQFLSGVVLLTEMAGFTPFLLQLLALRSSTCLVSGHPPSSNQSSLSPLPLASSRSPSVGKALFGSISENCFDSCLRSLMKLRKVYNLATCLETFLKWTSRQKQLKSTELDKKCSNKLTKYICREKMDIVICKSLLWAYFWLAQN